MKTISTDNIKILRKKTGAGFLECKDALVNNNNSIDKAINFLRKKGLNLSCKNTSQTKLAGIIFLSIDNTKKNGVIMEVSAETDFVTKTPDFLSYVKDLSENLLYKNKFKANFHMTHDELCSDNSIKNEILKAMSKFKEKITINRAIRISTINGFLFGYLHNINNYGKIGSIITIDRDYDKFIDKVKDVAIHIIAMTPRYLTVNNIPENILLNEKNLYEDIVKKKYPEKNKSIIDKIINGHLENFYKDNVLLKQMFVKNPKLTMESFIDNSFILLDFIRFESGENK